MMNLYVSNLPYTLTDEELQGTFATYGHVSSARVVKDRESGRSQSFGGGGNGGGGKRDQRDGWDRSKRS